MATTKKELELDAVIGFAGSVPSGLFLADESHLMYPLGSTLIKKQLLKNKQEFFRGHTNPISAVAMTKDKSLIATGEEAPMGFKAKIIVWDAEEKTKKYTLELLHKGKIESICFSPNGEYLASLGGPDDNKLVLWDMKTGEAICGSPAHPSMQKHGHVVKFFNKNNEKLVTGGDVHLRTWEIDRKNRKLRPTDCKLGSITRNIHTVQITNDDEFIYAGTASGDVLVFHHPKNLFKGVGPKKKPLAGGVHSLCITKDSRYFVIGSGDGTVGLFDLTSYSITKKIKLDGRITSICLNEKGDHFFVGTANGNIYCVCLEDFEYELRRSSHHDTVNCVTFPAKASDIFVTGSKNDIRVWERKSTRELLRIQIPGVNCLSVDISADGKLIVSGWSDGKIRAFLPQSGRLIYAINNAHTGDILCVKSINDGDRIVSGGADGRVRVWSTGENAPTLITSWKEHKDSVTCLELNNDNSCIMSSSCDGSCILWDLENYHRKSALFDSNQFTHVLYHPDQSQLLTCGTDRKISWWDATKFETIRIADASKTASINALSISSHGECFVSVGGDQQVNLWKYDDGTIAYSGYGHSASVIDVAVC
eukprot:UN07080